MLKEFCGNINIHGFEDEMLEVPSISKKPLSSEIEKEIPAAMSLDKNVIQYSYPRRPVNPYQDKDQRVDREIKVDCTQTREGITPLPSYRLDEGDIEMGPVKYDVTDASQSTRED